jgi:peptidoglycan/LPS O-acetylase OafA/YrhL
VSPAAPAVRLRSIDFLRGLTALVITFGHALTAAPYTSFGPVFTELCVTFMWIAVNGIPVFFAVSGFCIHLGQSRHGGGFQFAAFWRRRLWRLYPTYFVALVASIGMLAVVWMAGIGEELLARYPEPRGSWIAADFAYHALMLHGFHPLFDQGAGNPPLWTLAREEYLYLMYPLLLVLRRRMPWYSVSAFLVGVTLVFQYGLTRFTASPDALWLLTHSAPALWIQWQLGVVAADAYRGEIRLPEFLRQARWIPLWMVLAYLFMPGTVFMGLMAFTALNACVRLEVDGRWPATGIVGAITRVGFWSYSLYLIHFPVQTIALAIANRLWPDVGLAGFVVRAVVLWAVSCVAGRVLFELVERHFVTLPRRRDDTPLAHPISGGVTQLGA